MYSDWDQNEEDEQGPDDLNQQLDLRKEDKKDDDKLIKQIKEGFILCESAKFSFVLCRFVYFQFK